MSDSTKTTRRDLVKQALVMVPASLCVLAAGKALAAGTTAPAAGGLKLVPETDATAKALKYVADATKGKREKRGTTEGKDQNCGNCQLYTKQGTVDGKEAGKCLMITGGLVTASGWCGSWVKKA